MANTSLTSTGQAAAALGIGTLIGGSSEETRYAVIMNGTNVPIRITELDTNTGIDVVRVRFDAHEFELDELNFPRGSIDFTNIVIQEHSGAILEYTVAAAQAAHTNDGIAIAAAHVNTLHSTSAHMAAKRDGTAADNNIWLVNLV